MISTAVHRRDSTLTLGMHRLIAVDVHIHQPVGVALAWRHDGVQILITGATVRAVALRGDEGANILRVLQAAGGAAPQEEAIVVNLFGRLPAQPDALRRRFGDEVEQRHGSGLVAQRHRILRAWHRRVVDILGAFDDARVVQC